MPIITPLFEIEIKTAAGKWYRVPAVDSISVSTSRKPEPDTATIKLPKMGNLTLDSIKKYDQMLIKFGHAEADYAPREVFLGIVTKIGPNFPLTIECKDWLWLISRAWFKDSDAKLPAADGSASLNSIMQALIANPGVGAEMLEGVELVTSSDYDTVKYYGEFRMGNRSYGKIFDDLLQHGWDMFIIPGTKKLWFGPRDNLPIIQEHAMTPVFRSGLNIINSDIEYESLSGVAWVEVRVSDKERKSKAPDGWFPKEVQFNQETGQFSSFGDSYSGDKNGQVIKLEISGMKKDAAYGPDQYASLFYLINSKRGLSGQFKTFGLGYFQHWMKCKLEIGLPGKFIDAHYYPSGIDYSYSASDGFKMDVHFETSRQEGDQAA